MPLVEQELLTLLRIPFLLVLVEQELLTLLDHLRSPQVFLLVLVEQKLLTLLDHQDHPRFSYWYLWSRNYLPFWITKITPGFPTGTSGAGTTYTSGSLRSPQVFLLVLVEQKLLTLLDHQDHHQVFLLVLVEQELLTLLDHQDHPRFSYWY